MPGKTRWSFWAPTAKGAARPLCERHPGSINPIHSVVSRETPSKRTKEAWVETRAEAGAEHPGAEAGAEEPAVEAGVEPTREAGSQARTKAWPSGSYASRICERARERRTIPVTRPATMAAKVLPAASQYQRSSQSQRDNPKATSQRTPKIMRSLLPLAQRGTVRDFRSSNWASARLMHCCRLRSGALLSWCSHSGSEVPASSG